MKTTIRVIRWPDSRGSYWLAEHREGRGYTPLRDFGKSHERGQECVRAGRALALERGLEFVSEVGINTED